MKNLNIILLFDRETPYISKRANIDPNIELLRYTVQLLYEYFFTPRIILITGHNAKNLMTFRDDTLKNVIKIQNERYHETSQVHSLCIALHATSNNKVLIIDNSQKLTPTILTKLCYKNNSWLFVDRKEIKNPNKIGCIINNGLIDNVIYGLNNTYNNICFFNGRDTERLHEFCNKEENKRRFLFEIFNQLIDTNIKLKPIFKK